MGGVEREGRPGRSPGSGLRAAAAWLAVVAGVLGSVLLASTAGAERSPRSPGLRAVTSTSSLPSTSTSTSTTSTTTTIPAPSAPAFARLGRYATAMRWVVVQRGSRQLRTLVLTPRDAGPGPFPLAVFAHGWNNEPAGYFAFLNALASSGFVVVAASSPGLAHGSVLLHEPGGDQEQVGDLPAVLTAAEHLHLAVTINPAQIVEIGQSRGATNVTTVAFNPADRDPRVDAFVALSVLDLPANGRYLGENSAPVFYADSVADEYHLWPDSVAMYRATRGTRVLVGIGMGEGHLAPWVNSTAFNRSLWQAVVDFCGWVLGHRASAVAQLAADLHHHGTSLRVTS